MERQEMNPSMLTYLSDVRMENGEYAKRMERRRVNYNEIVLMQLRQVS